jgi:hypothetical protein
MGTLPSTVSVAYLVSKHALNVSILEMMKRWVELRGGVTMVSGMPLSGRLW